MCLCTDHNKTKELTVAMKFREGFITLEQSKNSIKQSLCFGNMMALEFWETPVE